MVIIEAPYSRPTIPPRDTKIVGYWVQLLGLHCIIICLTDKVQPRPHRLPDVSHLGQAQHSDFYFGTNLIVGQTARHISL